MSLYDWLLFLHVLSAFSLVAAVVVYSYLLVGAWNVRFPAEALRTFRIARVGDVLVQVGAIGTLAFGVWLVLKEDAYGFGDAWIIIALVLWVAIGGIGPRSAKIYDRARKRALALVVEGRNEPDPALSQLIRSPARLALQATATLLVLLLLLDMIFKPGS